MTFTAHDLSTALSQDGNLINGEKLYGEDPIRALWWEEREGAKLDVLGLGEFEVVDHVVGKKGTVTTEWGGNIWSNYIILKHEDRFFRFNGAYDSWDPQGWNGEVEEVVESEKIIKVWEKA